MSEEISGMTVIYLIAVGFQVFVLLFIFTKRQIMRFTFTSRKEPHVPIAHGAPKEFRRRILGQISAAGCMEVEPKLVDNVRHPPDTSNWYRMKMMDDVKLIDVELEQYRCGFRRRPKEQLYRFLLTLKAGPLTDLDPSTIQRLGQLYERARYLKKAVTKEEYEEYCDLLQVVLASIRRNRHRLADAVPQDPVDPVHRSVSTRTQTSDKTSMGQPLLDLVARPQRRRSLIQWLKREKHEETKV